MGRAPGLAVCLSRAAVPCQVEKSTASCAFCSEAAVETGGQQHPVGRTLSGRGVAAQLSGKLLSVTLGFTTHRCNLAVMDLEQG